jgi:uncharacterized membrane protein YjgN (DUF898 family)
MKSEFRAGLIEDIVTTLIAGFIIAITFGIATPWAVVFKEKWKAANTVIDGKELTFDGNGMELFGQFIVWFLLTIVTLGIYGFWLNIKMHQWIVSHTHFLKK